MSTKSLKEKEMKKKGDTLPAGRFTQQSEKKKKQSACEFGKNKFISKLWVCLLLFAFCFLPFAFCSLFFLIFVNHQYDMIQMIDKEKQVLNFVDSLM